MSAVSNGGRALHYYAAFCCCATPALLLGFVVLLWIGWAE